MVCPRLTSSRRWVEVVAWTADVDPVPEREVCRLNSVEAAEPEAKSAEPDPDREARSSGFELVVTEE
jgi:hypothetical protein